MKDYAPTFDESIRNITKQIERLNQPFINAAAALEELGTPVLNAAEEALNEANHNATVSSLSDGREGSRLEVTWNPFNHQYYIEFFVNREAHNAIGYSSSFPSHKGNFPTSPEMDETVANTIGKFFAHIYDDLTAFTRGTSRMASIK